MTSKKISIFTDIENIEEKAMLQFKEAMSLDCNVEGALMPDVHTGYTIPIGAIVKTKGKVFPSYIGNDIGCGVASYRLNIVKNSVTKNTLLALKDYILNRCIIEDQTDNIFKDIEYYKDNLQAPQEFINKAKTQYGTLGGGNHFLELGYDVNNDIWITIHSGSRGFGGSIAQYYMKLAFMQEIMSQNKLEELTNTFAKEFEQKNNWSKYNPIGFKKAKEKYINNKIAKYKEEVIKSHNTAGHYGFQKGTKEFENYINDMNLAILFGIENRRKMAEIVKEGLKLILKRNIKIIQKVETNHNHAIVIDDYVIHRKGASYAPKNNLIAIPANMRDGVYIVRSKGNKDSLESTSHGAGRVLSRKKAKEILSYEKMKKEMENIVNNHDERTVDEAPDAYKNINVVMNQQNDLVKIVNVIKPLLNIKG